MKNKVSVIGLTVGIAVASLLNACAPRSVSPAPTVEYYREHPDQREAQMRVCAGDPGTLGKTADCVNALQATNLEKRDSLRELPPMNIPKDNAPQRPESEAKL